MFADDSPGYPACFYLRFALRGRLDPRRLAEAGKLALARHPLLRARLVGEAVAVGETLRWEVDEATFELPVVWGTPDGASIDPTRALALRLFVEDETEAARLTLQVHHAACDGVGASTFVVDLLRAYDAGAAAFTVGDATATEATRVAWLERRGGSHLLTTERRARLAKDLARIWLYFRRFPQPLAPSPVLDGAEPARPASVARRLADAEVASLRAAARRVGATFNDLLLTAAFLALDGWNRDQGGRRPLRLVLPINMRLIGDRDMPAANVVSMCFLDRQGTALDDAEALLKGVVAETSFIKSHRMGHALIGVAAALSRVRGGLKALMTRRWPWATAASAVISNLGAPFASAKLPTDSQGRLVAGGLTLDWVEFLPPIRPGMSLAIGVLTYGGATAFAAHYDASQLAAQDVSAITSAFLARLSAVPTGPEPQVQSFAALIEKHTARRLQGASFRSLPIGKHVAATARPELTSDIIVNNSIN